MSNCTQADTTGEQLLTASGTVPALTANLALQTLVGTVCSTGDDDETSLIRGLCWTFFTLAVVSVAIRTASRVYVFVDSFFGYDDAAIIITLCILAGNMGLMETREWY